MLAKVGSSIYASKSGRVVYVGNDEKGYGLYIEIAHPDGKTTRYAHLSRIETASGDWVSIRQIVGQVGKTGNAASLKILPHLHFEIRELGKPMDPLNGEMDPTIKVVI